jgi:hypothetical protein
VPLFKATGYCNHGKKEEGVASCPLEFSIVMRTLPMVKVTFRGEGRHDLRGSGARPIKGRYRQELRDCFVHGEKPGTG